MWALHRGEENKKVTRAELLNLLKQDEDPFVERKTKGHRSDVIRTLVAFANSVPQEREAVLFVGIRPDKTPTGVDDADKLQRDVSDWVKQCYPPIDVTYEVLYGLGSRPILAVIVPASAQRPHFAAPAYVRDGSKTVKAPEALYDELIASRNTKAGAILRQKGEVVTVEELHPQTWSGRQITVSDHRIDGCTAHSVQLHRLGDGTNRSIPLEQVTISEDPQHLRPLMLIIKPLT